jgi:hypothetical protein
MSRKFVISTTHHRHKPSEFSKNCVVLRNNIKYALHTSYFTLHNFVYIYTHTHTGQVKGDDPDKKGYPGPPCWGLGMGLTTTTCKIRICLKTSTEASKEEEGWGGHRQRIKRIYKNIGLNRRGQSRALSHVHPRNFMVIQQDINCVSWQLTTARSSTKHHNSLNAVIYLRIARTGQEM